MILAQEYTTLESYQEGNNLAHETLVGVDGYTSEKYADEKGTLTINGTYLLFLLPKFETELTSAGFVFTEFDESIIFKAEEIE